MVENGGSCGSASEQLGWCGVAPDGGLVGREAELGVLWELVDRVAAGRGGSVWVEGEPGIGKTVLVAAGLVGARGLGCEVFGGIVTS